MEEAPKHGTNSKKDKKYTHFVNTNNHNIKKRTPHKPDARDSVIYVSNKSNTTALLDKCDKLIKNDNNEIIIHCMGAATQRGILLALQLQEKYPIFEVSVNTSTIELIDDLEPTNDEVDYDILKRNNSALQIRIFRPTSLQF